MQGSYPYDHTSHTSPAVGLAPHYEGNISQSQAYPPPVQGSFPTPMNPPQPYTTATGPYEAHQIPGIQPPPLSYMGAHVAGSVGIISNFLYGSNPQLVVCGKCSKEGKTKVKKSPNIQVWTSCCICICMGCVAGCCLIPFAYQKNYDAKHSCSSCGEEVGVYKAFSFGL
jgi:lipopolysaccharide-induced tumor necrosis factor-alpha factor